MNKKGFTLSEVLITMAVLAILLLILIPILTQVSPNKHKVMFKKAYEVAERTLGDLINDDGLYPDELGLIYTTDAVTYNGQSYNGTTKFCQLFATRLNLSGGASCGASGFDFTTNDGIVWDMPTGNFTVGGSQTITIDVSGGIDNTNARKNPNCRCTDAPTCTDCAAPDQFEIYIWNDGRITVDGPPSKESEYLKSLSSNN